MPMRPMIDFKPRPGRDGAVGNEGDVAVAKSLDMSAVPDRGQIKPHQRLPISAPEIGEAYATLMKYKQGKANLERRLIENQQWYKLRQWECMRKSKEDMVEPVSAWLLNSIANKHADAMDNFPAINVLPREEGDKAEAKMLASILPVVLDQCDFEQVYSDEQDEKIESGTGVYGVFWDPNRHNGLGDVKIVNVDLINLFWEPGITDIQDSRNVFYVSLQDNDLLEAEYPAFKDKLSGPVVDVSKYVYDDTVDTSDKSAVVEWYYKKKTPDGRTLLHYCKFIAGQTEALFATENEQGYADKGWYEHGQYPFIFDRLMRCKGTPTGFGFIDVGKSAQEYIDRGKQAILQNMLWNARPRHFIRDDGSVNEEEFADATKPFVHVDGKLGEDSVAPIRSTPMSSLYLNILDSTVLELKETTGNRDVNNGGTTHGVTAASAIAAMQEAGGRLARDSNKGSYRAFRQMILMVIELVRQFYDQVRQFRIVGQRGVEEFVQYSNAGIKPQPQGTLVNGVPMAAGVKVGYRLPVFDIEVTAEKQSPYSKMAQNELALQLYTSGFFTPQNADAALSCLEMMDFDHKDDVMQLVQKNQTLLQMVQTLQLQAAQMAQLLDSAFGTQLTASLGAELGAPVAEPGKAEPGRLAAEGMQALGGQPTIESGVTRRARQQAADTTAPR